MIDRQKVIEGAKHCKATECDGCPYARDGDNTEACSLRLRNDAFALLTPVPADLTPYLTPAATLMASPWCKYTLGREETIEERTARIARALRAAARGAQ